MAREILYPDGYTFADIEEIAAEAQESLIVETMMFREPYRSIGHAETRHVLLAIEQWKKRNTKALPATEKVSDQKHG